MKKSMWLYNFLTGILKWISKLLFQTKTVGLENENVDGPVIYCINHMSNWDPVIVACETRKPINFMAKKELFKSPIMSRIFSLIGAFPVDRGNTDITAIKTAMQTLKDNNKLVIFPEGTRVRKGKTVEPHSGAILIAHRMNAPLVPVYLSVNKGLFRPIDLIFDTPYVPQFDTPKPDAAALEQAAKKLMDQVYDLGQPKKGGA